MHIGFVPRKPTQFRAHKLLVHPVARTGKKGILVNHGTHLGDFGTATPVALLD